MGVLGFHAVAVLLALLTRKHTTVQGGLFLVCSEWAGLSRCYGRQAAWATCWACGLEPLAGSILTASQTPA